MSDEQLDRLRRRFAALRETSEYQAISAIFDITEDLCVRMEELGVSRSELANRLGVSPARVTNILRGRNNFTVQTLAELAMALECDVRVTFAPRAASATQHSSIERTAKPEVAAESHAPYGRGPASYASRDGEIRELLRVGKLKVQDGEVLMRAERDGLYYPATFRAAGPRGAQRTNIGSRAYYRHRILSVASEMSGTP